MTGDGLAIVLFGLCILYFVGAVAALHHLGPLIGGLTIGVGTVICGATVVLFGLWLKD